MITSVSGARVLVVGLTAAIVVDPSFLDCRPRFARGVVVVGMSVSTPRWAWPRCIDLRIDHVEDFPGPSVADVVVPWFVDSVGLDVCLKSRGPRCTSILIDSIGHSEYSVYSKRSGYSCIDISAVVVVPTFVDSVGLDVHLKSRASSCAGTIDSTGRSECSVYPKYFGYSCIDISAVVVVPTFIDSTDPFEYSCSTR